jgi:uroporphyrinogen-III synthase
MLTGNFQGLRVLALESRRATEIAKLIRNYGGEPTVAPALREVPVESNLEALDFAGRLMQGGFDLVIFFTGVGVRRLVEVASVRYDRDRFLEALRRVKVAARGPKPTGALGELGVRVEVSAPEPYTWREMIGALDTAFGPSLGGLRGAIQEYGTTNPDFLAALSQRRVQWTRVPVYHWALPNDLEPLKAAVRSIAAGELDVIVFLTGVQATHLFQVAEEMSMTEALRAGMRNMVVLSIGPSTTEELELHGIHPDFTPSHPKMGLLINRASACAAKLLEEKRGPAARINERLHEP